MRVMTMTTPRWTFADRLSKARRESGLSVDELAAAAGQHPNTIRAWERGDRTPRDPWAVARVYEEATGVDGQWILAEGEFRTGSFSSEFDELGIDIAA